MKHLSFLSFILLSIIFISCSSDDISTSNNTGTIFDIPIYQYSENNYLLDTSYGRSFESFHENGSSSIDIQKVEVWVYCDPNDTLGRRTVGFTNIPARPSGGYDTNLVADSAGFVRHGYLKKLYDSEFKINPRAAFITIRNFTPIPPHDAIFVAYSVSINGQSTIQYGDFINDMPKRSLLTLKILRDRGEQSPRENAAYTQLWNLMLKNIYSIEVTNLMNNSNKFSLNVYKSKPNMYEQISYSGSPSFSVWANGKGYMYLTGIDRKGNGAPSDTVPGGDGQFDFFPGNTIDLENGSIIFPTLKPFSTAMINKGVIPDSLGANDSLYYNSIGTLTNGNFPIYFKIKGTIYN